MKRVTVRMIRVPDGGSVELADNETVHAVVDTGYQQDHLVTIIGTEFIPTPSETGVSWASSTVSLSERLAETNAELDRQRVQIEQQQVRIAAANAEIACLAADFHNATNEIENLRKLVLLALADMARDDLSGHPMVEDEAR